MLFVESFRTRVRLVQSKDPAAAILCLLLLYTVGTSVYQASGRPFWFDEIVTLTVARQETFSAVRRALYDAADSNPPVFYLLERYAARLIADEHIGYRLTSIFGFGCVLVCLFAYVRPRTGSIAAFIATLVVSLTVLFHEYSVEARPYGLVVGCVALALICWQRAPRLGWTVLFSLSLAAAVSLHYYAVLAFVPFGIAEVAYLLKHGRWRFEVWTGLACATVPLIVFFPLLTRLKAYYGLNFWAKPSVATAYSTYGDFFKFLDNGTAVGIVLLLTILFFSAVLTPKLWQLTPIVSLIPIEELVLAIGFVWLPFLGFIIARIGNGGMTSRYTMPAILGIALTVTYLCRWMGHRVAILMMVLLLSVFACREALFWVNQPRNPPTITSPSASIEKLLEVDAQRDLPVVISSGHEYLQIAYYGSPRFSQRFFALVDRAEAIQYVRSDTLELALLAVRQYLPLNIYEYSEFASVHPVFLLYSNRDSLLDWWPTRLSRDGHFLRVLAFERGHILYLVKLKASVSAPLPH